MPHINQTNSAVARAVAGVLATANAAAEPQATSQLPEIVVAARQRAERIEDVPVTVQAFTAKDIKAAGIERPQVFIALTPGVAQVQTAEAGDMQVVIRGINTGRDAETNFALVIDGVLQTNPNALIQELSNVSQIEVLKGPQGAPYGRNALVGAGYAATTPPRGTCASAGRSAARRKGAFPSARAGSTASSRTSFSIVTIASITSRRAALRGGGCSVPAIPARSTLRRRCRRSNPARSISTPRSRLSMPPHSIISR